MNKNTVGNNIKRIREEKGMTQKELGVLCGMSESQIGQYENGYRSPKFETVLKIANALEVSYNLLIEPYNDSTFVCDKLDESIMLKHTFNQSIIKYGKEKSKGTCKCAKEHEQLLQWLIDYKELKKKGNTKKTINSICRWCYC